MYIGHLFSHCGEQYSQLTMLYYPMCGVFMVMQKLFIRQMKTCKMRINLADESDRLFCMCVLYIYRIL